jgi:translation initiation factor 1
MPSSGNDRPVYITGVGRIAQCKVCGQPEGECRCPSRRAAAGGPTARLPRDGVVRLLRDKSGRKGKAVTVVAGLPNDPVLLADLARSLKKHLGCGGTVRGDVIELQCDVRETIRQRLEALGYKVKIAGG